VVRRAQGHGGHGGLGDARVGQKPADEKTAHAVPDQDDARRLVEQGMDLPRQLRGDVLEGLGPEGVVGQGMDPGYPDRSRPV
jgi:hypothetical protein